jgi:hypothetical protein
VVPDPLVGYFAAATAAAGALIGLLFVAISLKPDSIFGESAQTNTRRLAESSFTALVNAFFVSLVAIIPGTNLGWVSAIMAVLSLYSTFARRVRDADVSNLAVLGFTTVLYLGQLGIGIALIVVPGNADLVYKLAYLAVAAFAIALARAWALMTGQDAVKPPHAH